MRIFLCTITSRNPTHTNTHTYTQAGELTRSIHSCGCHRHWAGFWWRSDLCCTRRKNGQVTGSENSMNSVLASAKWWQLISCNIYIISSEISVSVFLFVFLSESVFISVFVSVTMAQPRQSQESCIGMIKMRYNYGMLRRWQRTIYMNTRKPKNLQLQHLIL